MDQFFQQYKFQNRDFMISSGEGTASYFCGYLGMKDQADNAVFSEKLRRIKISLYNSGCAASTCL